MEPNYYMINMQKLLYVVKELHSRGYENIHIVPHLSPSGMSWRCLFVTDFDLERVNAGVWLQSSFDIYKEIGLSISELTDKLEKEHSEFLRYCNGRNEEYVTWFKMMLVKLKFDELPYAFADYFQPTDYWKTSDGQQITTLPDEKKYYYNY